MTNKCGIDKLDRCLYFYYTLKFELNQVKTGRICGIFDKQVKWK